MVKIAAVSMVKNECDIIEWFIKLNARFVDHFYIIDHNSNDGTTRILQRLEAGGAPITCSRVETVAFEQSRLTSEKVRSVAATEQFDYIIPLDADEFLSLPESGDLGAYLQQRISPEQFGTMDWLTFCPVSDDYYDSDNPLYEHFRPRSFEPASFSKVILGNEFAKHCAVAAGNHSAKNKRYKNAGVALDLPLYHVPVRSSQQLIRKAILGDYATRLNGKRKKDVNFHWRVMAGEIRDNDYQLSSQHLMNFALHYGVPADQREPVELDEKGPRIGDSDMSLVLSDEARINNLETFDQFIGQLVTERVANKPKPFGRLTAPILAALGRSNTA